MGSAKFLGMGSRSAVEKMIDLAPEDLPCLLSKYFSAVLSPMSYNF